jgi:hypothetical protein
VSVVNSGVIREAIAPERLGTATISPAGAFEAGSYASFTLTYTAGVYGIDDSGALRICFRFASDQSNPQFTDPAAPNYTTVEASNGAVLDYRFDQKGNVRPWDRTLSIKVVKGYLREGDRITVRFGVTGGGSPGMRLQTFCEDSFEFRVLVDPIATFNFQPVPDQPHIAIVPGAPARFLAVLPTLRRVGEPFSLKLKGEDRWGNPSDRCDLTLALRARGTISGLPGSITLTPGLRAFSVDGLSAAAPATSSSSCSAPMARSSRRPTRCGSAATPRSSIIGAICTANRRKPSARAARVNISPSRAISLSSMRAVIRVTTFRLRLNSGRS